jgi:hypothetical protein
MWLAAPPRASASCPDTFRSVHAVGPMAAHLQDGLSAVPGGVRRRPGQRQRQRQREIGITHEPG